MKINIKSLRRDKKVYYYDRHNGVLERRVTTRYRLFSGTLVALFMFGGAGALTSQVIKHTQQNDVQATSIQRQTVAVDTTQKPGEEDKLKNAEKKAREDEQLAKKVKDKLKNIPGGQKWSVHVRDVNSDRMANVNADNLLNASSFSNLLVTAPLEAKQPASKWGYRLGQSTTAKCLQELISANDQTCKQLINRSAKLADADKVLEGHGLKKTVLNDKEQKTTAREMGELLYKLQNSQVLSDKARRIVFDGLYGQKQREGIPSSCNNECLVASIAGEDKGVRHNAAIVTKGSSKYVVVIMTNGGSWSQIADVSSMIRSELQP